MFCIKCGKKLEEDSVFCEFCGTKVEPLEETEEIEVVQEKVKNDKIEEKIEKKDETTAQKMEVEEFNLEETMSEIEPKVEKKSFSELDAAVADLRPDDLDELIPKKVSKGAIIFFFVFGILIVGGFIFLKDNKNIKITKEKKTDYQTIINEYAKSIENVASDYLLDNELVNDFSDISDKVKYDKHKVSCDNVFINIDGTVYLSECSIDGVKVEEVYGKKKSILTKDNADACYVNHNEDENELEFYVDSELVSIYQCDHHKCGIYKEDFEYNSCLDMIAVIEDGSSKYLYHYRQAEKLLDELDEIYDIKKGNKIDGFIVKDKETKKYGYVTTRGVIKIDLSYDVLGLVTNDILDERGIDIVNDRVVVAKDGKYGVISLSKGSEILSFDYDLVYLGQNDNYVVKKDDEYILINEKGDKILEKSYDMIFTFDDVLVVSEDKKLKIVDYKENKIVDDEIKTYVDYKESGANGIYGYNAKLVDNNISIEVNKSSGYGYDTIKYAYNIDKKKLVEEN